MDNIEELEELKKKAKAVKYTKSVIEEKEKKYKRLLKELKKQYRDTLRKSEVTIAFLIYRSLLDHNKGNFDVKESLMNYLHSIDISKRQKEIEKISKAVQICIEDRIANNKDVKFYEFLKSILEQVNNDSTISIVQQEEHTADS